VKGWLASDGEARFAATGLKGRCKVGSGVEKQRLGWQWGRSQHNTTRPERGGGAGEGCTAAVDVGEAGRGCEMESRPESWQRGFCNWLRKETALVPKPSTASILSWVASVHPCCSTPHPPPDASLPAARAPEAGSAIAARTFAAEMACCFQQNAASGTASSYHSCVYCAALLPMCPPVRPHLCDALVRALTVTPGTAEQWLCARQTRFAAPGCTTQALPSPPSLLHLFDMVAPSDDCQMRFPSRLGRTRHSSRSAEED
jgi:hypothetical protein